jgi:hypothetical protein
MARLKKKSRPGLHIYLVGDGKPKNLKCTAAAGCPGGASRRTHGWPNVRQSNCTPRWRGAGRVWGFEAPDARWHRPEVAGPMPAQLMLCCYCFLVVFIPCFKLMRGWQRASQYNKLVAAMRASVQSNLKEKEGFGQ